MKSLIRVILLGLGRTGREIASVMLSQPGIEFVGAFCRSGGGKAGRDLGEVLGGRDVGIKVRGADELEEFLENNRVDVALDFTSPESTMRHFKALSRHKVRAVIGTTGFTVLQQERLRAIAEKYKNGVVYAPNITLGVNVLMILTNLAASILEGYDATIVETHFKGKKDAPSGTAKKIAQEVQRGAQYRGEECGPEDIPIVAIRAGGVIGRHSVLLQGEYDEIEISHESFSRKAFALGALRAVRQIHGKAGYFEMKDVLDLQKVMHGFMERSSSPPSITALANNGAS